MTLKLFFLLTCTLCCFGEVSQQESKGICAFITANPFLEITAPRGEKRWDALDCTNPCTFSGVSCANNDKTVVKIDLENIEYNNQGTIPTEIGLFSNLTYFSYGYADRNKIQQIPTEFGLLTKIQTLSFQFNNFSSIPTQLGRLSNLTNFVLTDNSLGGTVPTQLGNLVKMQYLFLNKNSLSGTIPTQLGRFTALKILYLNGNRLGGTIPTQFSNFTSLSGFVLDYNFTCVNKTIFPQSVQKYCDPPTTPTPTPTPNPTPTPTDITPTPTSTPTPTDINPTSNAEQKSILILSNLVFVLVILIINIKL